MWVLLVRPSCRLHWCDVRIIFHANTINILHLCRDIVNLFEWVQHTRSNCVRLSFFPLLYSFVFCFRAFVQIHVARITKFSFFVTGFIRKELIFFQIARQSWVELFALFLICCCFFTSFMQKKRERNCCELWFFMFVHVISFNWTLLRYIRSRELNVCKELRSLKCDFVIYKLNFM